MGPVETSKHPDAIKVAEDIDDRNREEQRARRDKPVVSKQLKVLDAYYQQRIVFVFQESFSFFADLRKLHLLKVAKCPKLMLLADAILSESSIKTFEIINHVEIHGKAIAVTSVLEELNIENSVNVINSAKI